MVPLHELAVIYTDVVTDLEDAHVHVVVRTGSSSRDSVSVSSQFRSDFMRPVFRLTDLCIRNRVGVFAILLEFGFARYGLSVSKYDRNTALHLIVNWRGSSRGLLTNSGGSPFSSRGKRLSRKEECALASHIVFQAQRSQASQQYT
jgi:hypothetical protein